MALKQRQPVEFALVRYDTRDRGLDRFGFSHVRLISSHGGLQRWRWSCSRYDGNSGAHLHGQQRERSANTPRPAYDQDMPVLETIGDDRIHYS